MAGELVVVTGGMSGIGAAAIQYLAKEGWTWATYGGFRSGWRVER